MIIEDNIILNNVQIEQKIKRISYQIYENNIDENEIIVAGINGNGFILANKIAFILEQISPLKIDICEIHINKSQDS